MNIVKFKLYLSALAFAACGRSLSNNPTVGSELITTTSINSLSMSCQGSGYSCSGAVGGFLSFKDSKLETFCTGFVLTESLDTSIVATSSHCLKPIHQNIESNLKIQDQYIFAKFDISIPNKIKFYKINQVLNSAHSHTENLGLDYAYLSTVERINTPSSDIHHNSIERSELSLKVVTANFDKDSLNILIRDHNNCSSVVDQKNIFKFLIYTPENFGINNCSFNSGNSGAPVYFNNKLAGILNSGLVNSLPTLTEQKPYTKQAYANNILCTDTVYTKKASHYNEKPLFRKKWLCAPSFEHSELFNFLLEQIDHVNRFHE